MTSRSKDIWNESPVERLLMKLYRVPASIETDLASDVEFVPPEETPRKSPKEVRAAARRALQRELTEPTRHLRY